MIKNKEIMNNKYLGTTPILESDIPNAKKCHVNHGLVTAIPCEDMTFGIFKRKKSIIKTFKKYTNKEKDKQNGDIKERRDIH